MKTDRRFLASCARHNGPVPPYIPPLIPMLGRWLPMTEAPEIRHLLREIRPPLNGLIVTGRETEHLALVTPQLDALCCWQRSAATCPRFGRGVYCLIFRNRSHWRGASLLIEAMTEHAMARWPGERLMALCNRGRSRGANPLAPFLRAGWTVAAITDEGHALCELHTNADS